MKICILGTYTLDFSRSQEITVWNFATMGMILFPSNLALRILGKMEREKPQAAYHRQCLLNKAISVI